MVSKIRKKAPHAGKEPIDAEAIKGGTIPWSVKELNLVLHKAAEIYRTPHDDWDRRPRTLNLENPDGTVARLLFNSNVPMLHIIEFIRKRYDMTLSDTETMAHARRFWEILDFLRNEQQRLFTTELIVPDKDGQWQISGYLLEVLATHRFTRSQGDGFFTFDADDVIIEAGRRRQKDAQAE